MTSEQFAFTAAFTLGLLGVTLHRYHLLSVLLCLEGMMLSLFIAFSTLTLQLNSANAAASPLILLAFSACEASAGLALLVATSRTHGTDRLQSFNLLQC
uniref:NADH-ubiquinone oxidoreductase chain 4L n=1 Tax=Peltorhamphus novaezeelandiae TaxID=526620 RepID=W5QKU0_9PLEU|nr:NADH dehydrogenase subunit 4L [Peltorhamphus novaezeelandiae]AFH09406.1 NADH dehydrogenase subunit 4L [Peltorhamphus novaezeelandiae]